MKNTNNQSDDRDVDALFAQLKDWTNNLLKASNGENKKRNLKRGRVHEREAKMILDRLLKE